MRNITRFLFFAVVMVCGTAAFAQSTVTGVTIDPETNASLPGVNVIEKGTTNGVSSDFDGNFSITTTTTDAVLLVSYVGFLTKEIAVSGDTDLGNIVLEPSQFGLQEVQIIASVAVDRKTPVAVSTIKAADIELKLGTQEFPEILKSTPGVYATKAGGGYGDGRINLRGFNSENVAVMINGVPVNDMENGRVYWSNWAGLADVTSSMQVQRGLGASKVAVPSIGGTINILSKTTDVEEGGNFYSTLANDGYLKYGMTYSTGLNENGFAATVSASRTEGDGYVDGTEFKGTSYFINLSKQLGTDHKLSFTAFGAKQRHGQRQNRHLIEDYRLAEQGIKLNTDWGYKNGQVTHVEDNFYHKPQISLNHYWTISDKSSLSTAAYVSFGSGGGGGTLGSDLDANDDFEGDARFKFSSADYKIGNFGPMDLDRIVAENKANGAYGSSAALRASRNDHNWYGVLSTFKTDLTDSTVLLLGVDIRDYKGIHFREVTDLLGGQFIINDDNENNPLFAAQVGDKIDYYDEGFVGWLGGFAQLEYSKDKLAAFISLAASNTSYKRKDYFSHNLTTDPDLFETDKYNFGGFSIKGGANYNLNDNHNIFANIGYFEKAPGFDSVFYNFNNEDVNPDAENQKIESYELGYGYRSDKFSANVNVYRTAWRDRTETETFQLNADEDAIANILGVNAIHKGLEIDFVYRASDKLRFTGMASFGDWRWENDVTDVQIFNEAQEVVETVDLYISDLPVSDAAQTTFALGMNYKISPATTLIVDYNYYDRIYADFDPSDRGTAGAPDSWQMPDYGLFDVVLRHNFDLGPFDASLTGRINNLFDTQYISDADDGTGSVAETALVYFGYGRTYSVGAKFNF
jgi:outer membrane cobalamin receptor